jgi:hypothetical protein
MDEKLSQIDENAAERLGKMDERLVRMEAMLQQILDK